MIRVANSASHIFALGLMNTNWKKSYFLAVLPFLIPFVCWQISESVANLNGCTIGFKTGSKCDVFGFDLSIILWLLRFGGQLFTMVGAFVSVTAVTYVFLGQIEPFIFTFFRFLW